MSPKKVKSEPCFFAKSFRIARAALAFLCSGILISRLQSVHGFRACSLKDKRKQLDFIFLGFKKRTKNETKMKNLHDIGQIVASRALDDTKKMRKAGADIFA